MKEGDFMAKCDRDCFNCKFSDCIVNGILSEDRKEIRERDKRYDIAVESRSITKRPKKLKHKGRIVMA